eukprot:COSAG01_NODE_31_length_35900_cov_44.332169_6_plen_92_part_00
MVLTLPAGVLWLIQYVLGLRWDCESSAQVCQCVCVRVRARARARARACVCVCVCVCEVTLVQSLTVGKPLTPCLLIRDKVWQACADITITA